MTAVAERHGTLASGFDAFRRESGFGPAGLAERREAAFARFLGRGFHTTREEDWRFTNVAPVAALPFERAPKGTISRPTIDPWLFGGAIAPLVVLVNGRLAPALSNLGALPSGVTVRSGEDGYVPSPTSMYQAFVDLNTAFFPEAVTIAIAAHTVVPEPIHLLCLSAGVDAPVLVSPRIVVRVGEHAEAILVESHAAAGTSEILTNVVMELRVGASAVLDHTKIVREAPAFHMASIFAHADRAATFTSHGLTFGGRIVRNDIVSVLGGEGAECTLNGLYVADGDSLVDTHTTIDHAMPHCPSHELYKGILAGRARAVFNGKIIVRPDAQKTDAKQTNKALLLTDDAQVNTKPQLEIFADDVKCTHGAAIGQLDEDAMFYLRARGISAIAARNMLVHAFAGEVLDTLKIEAVRDEAMRLMEEMLRLG